ncbi:hypothetical protein HY008_00280 [Candidatus Woesebacteria bacterium]|nr:hypothetical protein [Candidatus Woesebacteria bacterium]
MESAKHQPERRRAVKEFEVLRQNVKTLEQLNQLMELLPKDQRLSVAKKVFKP